MALVIIMQRSEAIIITIACVKVRRLVRENEWDKEVNGYTCVLIGASMNEFR